MNEEPLHRNLLATKQTDMCLLDHAGKVFNAHLVKRYGGVSTLPSSKELMLGGRSLAEIALMCGFQTRTISLAYFPGRSE